MPTTAARVAPYGITIFTEINDLAQQHNALNLGQGRPDFDGPSDVVAAFVGALNSGKHNQYAPSIGTLNARQAVANHAGRFYNLDIDPKHGVIITPGATEALFAAILGLVDKGDEVIVIEPYFDCYVPQIVMAGATPVYVPLHAPGWTLDPVELRAAFTSKTKAIIINSPQNPTGRVFTREELQVIADLCIEHDVIAISDEVYEHLTFDSAQHLPIAALPGMLERTVTISSMGKTFSVTGWRTAWAYGAPALIEGVARAHQYVTFASNHPAQEAAAYALNLPGTYYEELQAMYAIKRDILMGALTRAGFKAAKPEGTYFIVADFSDIFDGDDLEFARYMTTEVGVACIPPTFFYCNEHAHMASRLARFAFCKTDDMLRQAADRLTRAAR